MTNYNKDFDAVMDLLKSVPGVTEHLESLQVKLGKEILKRRMELGWTQAQLVKQCNAKGLPITQPMLSKMESGMRNIESKTYQSVMDVLGGIAELNIKFGPVSDVSTDIEKKSTDLIPVLA